MLHSPRTMPSWALLLRLLALLRPPGLSEACTCAPAHPQQHFCYSALGESTGLGSPQRGVVLWTRREKEVLISRTSCFLLGLVGQAGQAP